MRNSGCITETLEDLQEDLFLLRMTLLGAEEVLEPLAFRCLLRLSDYLEQHVDDLRHQLGGQRDGRG